MIILFCPSPVVTTRCEQTLTSWNSTFFTLREIYPKFYGSGVVYELFDTITFTQWIIRSDSQPFEKDIFESNMYKSRNTQSVRDNSDELRRNVVLSLVTTGYFLNSLRHKVILK